jgi:hypothetical protein
MMTDNTVRLLNPPKLYRSEDQPTPICPRLPLDVPQPRLGLFEEVHFASGGTGVVTGVEFISALANAIGYEGREDVGWHYTLTYEDGDICERWKEESLLKKLAKASKESQVQLLPLAS